MATADLAAMAVVAVEAVAPVSRRPRHHFQVCCPGFGMLSISGLTDCASSAHAAAGQTLIAGWNTRPHNRDRHRDGLTAAEIGARAFSTACTAAQSVVPRRRAFPSQLLPTARRCALGVALIVGGRRYREGVEGGCAVAGGGAAVTRFQGLPRPAGSGRGGKARGRQRGSGGSA